MRNKEITNPVTMVKKSSQVTSNFNLVRNLESFEINQRTSDGMFNATSLLKQWNSVEGNTRRRMNEFLNSPNTQEFIQTIKEEEGLIGKTQVADNQHGRKSVDVENQVVTKSYNDGVICFKKGRMTKGLGKTPDEYWFHPFLFIKFAMYLNPKFEYKVIKFVYDNLVNLRVDIANRYKRWTSALKSAGAKEPEDYQRIAKCMNYTVFGKHFEGIRDHATTEEIAEMQKHEDFIIKGIEYGMFTNLKQIRGYFEKEFYKKSSTYFK
jgi:hypothetical protein